MIEEFELSDRVQVIGVLLSLFVLLEYKLLLKEANTEFLSLRSLVPIPPFQYIDSVFFYCFAQVKYMWTVFTAE